MKIVFHKVGLRNIKTALAVFICMFIFSLFNNDNPFYACIAAVICMGDTVENSLIMGKNRIIGTILGGIIGVLFMFIGNIIPIFSIPVSILTALGIVVIIFLCTAINKPASVTIACIVFIGIMITFTGTASYHYALYRTIDTSIGVVVAILVNKYITPPKETP